MVPSLRIPPQCWTVENYLNSLTYLIFSVFHSEGWCILQNWKWPKSIWRSRNMTIWLSESDVNNIVLNCVACQTLSVSFLQRKKRGRVIEVWVSGLRSAEVARHELLSQKFLSWGVAGWKGNAANFYSLSFTYILTQLYILPYHFIYSDRMIQHVTDAVLVVRTSTIPTPSCNCEGSCESIKFFLLIVLRKI